MGRLVGGWIDKWIDAGALWGVLVIPRGCWLSVGDASAPVGAAGDPWRGGCWRSMGGTGDLFTFSFFCAVLDVSLWDDDVHTHFGFFFLGEYSLQTTSKMHPEVTDEDKLAYEECYGLSA